MNEQLVRPTHLSSKGMSVHVFSCALLCSSSSMHDISYCIAGNFRGRKLSHFVDLGLFVKVFSANIKGRVLRVFM